MNNRAIAGVIESYARWRSSRLGQFTDALEQRLLLDLLGPVAGKALLDVGCRDGELASELARRGAIVTGVDADHAMVAVARRRSEIELAQLRFCEGHAEQLPFNHESFDYVLAVAVLCFVADAERAVAEMARVLKPGGYLVIGELGRWNLWAMHRRVHGWLGNPTWRAAKFRSANQLRGLAHAAGLAVVEVRGAVHYPPCAIAAKIASPVDLSLGRKTTFGAAFLALKAIKPIETQDQKANDLMDTPAGSPQGQLIEFLRSLGIIVNPVAYPAHSTVEEGRALRGDMPGTFTKNLLLRDKKSRLFLIVAEESRSIDLRTLHANIGASGRLGFASSDTVREVLGVEPGALTPLALAHDTNRATTVVLDAKIMHDEQLNFHPLVNTQSVGLRPSELLRLIAATGHEHLIIQFEP